ncbi:GDSL-type esterase/lipase family protein [Pelagicoccus sp. SDUM812003]|uniref:GDSL-type esterase/lipase family protein n=1 Tax=Pelagicoccus sp. SDUM812003 TaxID=3041267 RepID=UPI00280DFDC1|nr:GDSL-type esterase/lipase family protein [Pelagicoccus sp. SDUM812003]MDQ8203247.1 GDSL-type esterase/lipase family protein [Pelagicoccus sp. SDUM812003]
MKSLPLLTLLACLLLAGDVFAQRAVQPIPRGTEFEWMSIAEWYRRHADDVEAAKKGEAAIVFAGDSITQGWEWAPAWERDFAPLQPVNIGIGGDKTENLLWRLQNGATGSLRPKLVVLLIGVNNFLHNDDSAQEVFAGVKANLEQLRTSFPEARILTLGVFPYGQEPGTRNRERVKVVNTLIETLADDTVTILDIGDALLEDDGTISKEIMGDFLHPTPEGYERINAAILPTIKALIEEN